MPVFNEKGCIGEVVDSWLLLLNDLRGWKLLIVDDGSNDGTDKILDSMAAKNSRLRIFRRSNGGHGSAVLMGYENAVAANAAWIFQTDSDDQIPAEEFLKLWERRNESRFILASRSHRNDPWHRIFLSKIHASLMWVFTGVRIPDPNVPFRLMDAQVVAQFLPRVQGLFAPNVFLSILAAKSGMPTLNVSVLHKRRRTGTASISFRRLGRVCLRCMGELWRFRRSL